MADDADDAAQSGGGSKKMLIIIIAVVVLLAGGGAAAFFLLSGADEPASEMMVEDGELDAELSDPSASAEDSAEATSDEGAAVDAFYVGMPRPFVFNVAGYGNGRLVEIRVQLLVRGSDNDTAARKHIPLIEDTLLTIFSGANAEKLSTHIGKQELRENALEAVQKALEPIVGNPVVEKLLFIGFVMQ